MRLDNFDLNLLVAFEVLIEERSVTRAARRLHVTQSAMSASLRRLRDSFGDAILAQHGKVMVPTPHALALAPQVSTALATLRRLIEPSGGFDPATATRVFRIAASDYITTVLLAPLVAALEREAPRIRLEIVLPDESTPERIAKGEFDLVLTPEEFLDPGHPAELLFEEAHVVVGCQRNPLLRAPMTSDAFAAAGHVAVRIDGRNTFIENELSRLGLVRRVEVYAPSFIQAPWLLPGTSRIALMHERLARLMVPALGLCTVAPPFKVPVMREMMQFHATRQSDEGLAWLRTRLGILATGSAGSLSDVVHAPPR
jgi:LysR family transcriptional regulator, nod-box dependent transcriptional activator